MILFLFVPALAVAEVSPYRGWDHLVERLRRDGVSESLLRRVYGGPELPPFETVPFSLRPRESHQMYSGFLDPKVVQEGRGCLAAHRNHFLKAERLFDVERGLVAAIILVESRCGRGTGRELVVNRLSRIGNIDEPRNLEWNLERLRDEDAGVTMDQVRERAGYLIRTFYPELRTLFIEQARGDLDILTLRGSIAGAFGWPQFLPSTYMRFGVDADRDGKVSLFQPADAIYSVAHFFAAHGWHERLPDAEKRAILWKYNKSDPYIDTILELSHRLS